MADIRARREGSRRHKHQESRVIARQEAAIVHLLKQTKPDIAKLQRLAPRGYLNDSFRRKVWPLLLGISQSRTQLEQEFEAARATEHKYTDQVRKDIERSMCHFDVTRAYKSGKRKDMRRHLSKIINVLFSQHPELHYVQGFHDIASVFLLVCGKGMGYKLTEQLALLHIRESLRSNLDTVVRMLDILFPLIAAVDPEVHSFLERSNVQSFFTLSWVLTWFSHNVDELSVVARFFDFLLASHPVMPVYLAVALIVSLREGLLECECEYAAVHQYYQNLPQHLNVSELFAEASRMFKRFPPKKIYKIAKVAFPKSSPLHHHYAVHDAPSWLKLPSGRAVFGLALMSSLAVVLIAVGQAMVT